MAKFHYFMHLQFKHGLYGENSRKQKKSTKYSKTTQKITKLLEVSYYHMWRLGKNLRKFGASGDIKRTRPRLIRQRKKHKKNLCQLPNSGAVGKEDGDGHRLGPARCVDCLPTAQLRQLPEAGWQSAKITFADCPGLGSRHRSRQSAMALFPVVIYGFYTMYFPIPYLGFV
jgi:hypothetical protein